MITSKVQGIFIALSLLLPVLALPLFSQETRAVKVMDFEQLKPLLHQQSDTLYIVNFWATWCAPCIEEIPYFEQIGRKFKGEKVKVLMVSLDFPKQLESRLVPFIHKHDMRNEVILLDDPRQNDWIPQVDEDWTGALPATLIYGQNFRYFYQKPFTYEELDHLIEESVTR
ncbi:TlpA disulfide reductase family protein [Petrimonas mucosa]|uniref:TlpA disulfide reductase family protein n=1 Tax=Petrimonas mucosa TaxID=1642646 RepID=UPI003BDBB644